MKKGDNLIFNDKRTGNRYVCTLIKRFKNDCFVSYKPNKYVVRCRIRNEYLQESEDKQR